MYPKEPQIQHIFVKVLMVINIIQINRNAKQNAQLNLILNDCLFSFLKDKIKETKSSEKSRKYQIKVSIREKTSIEITLKLKTSYVVVHLVHLLET